MARQSSASRGAVPVASNAICARGFCYSFGELRSVSFTGAAGVSGNGAAMISGVGLAAGGGGSLAGFGLTVLVVSAGLAAAAGSG